MWIDKGSYSGSALETYLSGSTVGAKVDVSSHVATSIAYSGNGVTLRQKETQTVCEFRGLTQAAANELVSLSADSTVSTTYYRAIGSGTEYVAVAITTGTKTEYVASRANEADGWHVTKTSVTYEAAEATSWTTTRPTAATSTGIQISKDMRKSSVWGGLYAVETTTVTEYRYLTKAEASTKVSDNTSNNVAMHCYNNYVSDPNEAYAWCYAQAGTNKTASARYVDAENGYTVTVTESVYSAEGTNWHY